MKYSVLALGLAASVYAQGVTEKITPKGDAPEGCQASYDGEFEISVRSFAKRDLVVRLPSPHPFTPATPIRTNTAT